MKGAVSVVVCEREGKYILTYFKMIIDRFGESKINSLATVTSKLERTLQQLLDPVIINKAFSRAKLSPLTYLRQYARRRYK